jgi:hypothetical protein
MTTQKNRLDKIESDIETIKSNHLFHIEQDVGELKITLKELDMKMWGLAVLVIGAAIAGMFV